MRDKGFVMMKLPNGVYFLWHLGIGVDARALLFAMKGIKSKGVTVVTSREYVDNGGVSSIKNYLESKNFVNVDRFFVCYNEGIKENSKRSRAKDAGIILRNITKNILYYDVNRWMTANQITSCHMEWFNEVINQMAQDRKYLLGQLHDRFELERTRKILKESKVRLERGQEELKNIRSIEEVNKTNIQNILRMKWIDKIEAGPNGSLRLLTKSMACTYVPNIGKYMDINAIKQNDILYRIMKYQCLGKYFIIQPDYYIIDKNYEIKGDSNDRYPKSRVRNVMMRQTYFQGQACHIGNGRACPGELSAAISSARKNGLDILLMSFEAYLRSINLPDPAGNRFWCLPMGDAEGNVEVWPYVEDAMKKNNVSFKDMDRSLEAYEHILENSKLRGYNEQFGCPCDAYVREFSEGEQDRRMKQCLELIAEREPKVHEQIIKRIEEGAVL